MAAIVLSWIMGQLNPINFPVSLFIEPNILMWNRPEVFAFRAMRIINADFSGSK